MSPTPYHCHPQRGGGRRKIAITAEDGSRLVLETLDKQLLAAKIIQAQVLLGGSRAEAEAIAAEAVVEQRHAKRWFGRLLNLR
jgi:hypothetical protein